MKKTVSLLLICLVAGLHLSSCRQNFDKNQVIWRFALEEIEGSIQHAYASKFKQQIEERSEGRIKVKIYTYGTLGNSDQVTEQLATGAIQFAMASPGHLGKVIPEVQVMLLHYILSDEQEINQELLIEGKTVNILEGLYQDKGLKLLSFYPEGEMVWTTQNAIKKPQDFAGVKIRVMPSPLLISTYESYGASPVAMPYGEVYSGLQLKMIDAQVNPVFAIQEMSFYEVTEHMIFSGCAQFITSAVAGLPFWKKLDKSDQIMVQEVITELQDFIFEYQKEHNEKRLQIIRDKKPEMKIIKLTPEQQQPFKERAQPLRNKYIEIGGPKAKQVLESIDQDIERIQKDLDLKQ